MTTPAPASSLLCLPCAVQVGFSGARTLFDRDGRSPAEISQIESAIITELVRELSGLRTALELGPHHFLAAISQIAVGGDTYFTRACGDRATGVALQRIFLPQPPDVYLSAVGSKGPDFSSSERAVAQELLRLPQIAHIQCVTNADSRHERLQETSHAILDECDVAICLVKPNPEIKPGGSGEFILLASQRKKPLLQIEVAFIEGRPKLTSTWRDLESFAPPALPSELAPLLCPTGSLPDASACCTTLKTYFSSRAKRHRHFFERAARRIILTHIAATLCATIALALPHDWVRPLMALLAAELAFLGWGYRTHHRLHHEKSSHQWAADRLGAEILRSVIALEKTHLHLAHLFRLRLQTEPGWARLFITLNLLQLISTRPNAEVSPQTQAAAYVAERLDRPDVGQIDYYRKHFDHANRLLRRLNGAFALCVGLAVVATAAKLAKVGGGLPGPDWLGEALGTLAVVFPMLAVGALSWASALDYQARKITYSEMLEFLQKQRSVLLAVSTHRELRKHILETEYRLLGETAEWFARRNVTDVA